MQACFMRCSNAWRFAHYVTTHPSESEITDIKWGFLRVENFIRQFARLVPPTQQSLHPPNRFPLPPPPQFSIPLPTEKSRPLANDLSPYTSLDTLPPPPLRFETRAHDTKIPLAYQPPLPSPGEQSLRIFLLQKLYFEYYATKIIVTHANSGYGEIQNVKSLKIGTVIVLWLDCSTPTNVNRVRFPVGSLQVFPHVGVVPDDAAYRQVFSCFSRPCIPALLRSNLISPSSALKTSMFSTFQIFPHHSNKNKINSALKYTYVRGWGGLGVSITVLLAPSVVAFIEAWLWLAGASERERRGKGHSHANAGGLLALSVAGAASDGSEHESGALSLWRNLLELVKLSLHEAEEYPGSSTLAGLQKRSKIPSHSDIVSRPRWFSGQTTRLAPRRSGFDSRVGSLPDSRGRESCRTMALVGGSPVSPLAFHSGAAPYSPRFTLIGSRDLDISPLWHHSARATVRLLMQNA
ncbi:hypothetical protein PR048_030567 [Dryococelus australis]|uniref:Uncharacterized protein n=1 Tax=Dryococelus australis TaxID=614101 RepID=A0ABQ9GBX5_9NEOP|nr:hypothetical protein PR048_030567 [Dryococelus australis]